MKSLRAYEAGKRHARDYLNNRGRVENTYTKDNIFPVGCVNYHLFRDGWNEIVLHDYFQLLGNSD